MFPHLSFLLLTLQTALAKEYREIVHRVVAVFVQLAGNIHSGPSGQQNDQQLTSSQGLARGHGRDHTFHANMDTMFSNNTLNHKAQEFPNCKYWPIN